MPVLEALQQSLKHHQEAVERIAAAEKEFAARKSELETLQRQHKEIVENQHKVNHSLASIPAEVAAAAGKKLEDPRKKLLNEQKEFAEKETATRSKKGTVETQMHAAQRQIGEARAHKQKTLKDCFLALKQAVEKCHATPSKVIKLLVLAELDETVRRSKLRPQELDQLFDKAFASDILNDLVRVGEASRAVLDLSDQSDVDRWKELPDEINATTQQVKAQEENLRTLPGRLEQTELSLVQNQRQHAENTDARESSGGMAKWSILAALGMAAILVAIGAAGVQPAFYGLVVPGAIAIFSLVQAIRSASLDHSATIAALESESADLRRQVENMPAAQQKLAADRGLLQERQQEFEAIHVRHPELRGFTLRQF